MTPESGSLKGSPENGLAAVDLFHGPRAKAFIWTNHRYDLETVEILLAMGQRLILGVPAQRSGLERLDRVLAAMLRAAILAAKGSLEGLRMGLYEPSMTLSRTLLELELSLDYILEDPAARNERAERYLAWAYRKRISALSEQISSPEIQPKLPSDYVEWVKGRLDIYQDGLQVLSEPTVRNKLERNWHPHRSVKGLATHLGRLDDYVQLYAPLSGMFVHAADPESHLVVEEGGQIKIKALVTTEPDPVGTALKMLAARLHQFLMKLREEWSFQETALGHLLLLASLRLIVSGGRDIAMDETKTLEEGSGIRLEDWPSAIALDRLPGREIMAEAYELVVAALRTAPAPLTAAEIAERTGLVLLASEGSGARIIIDGIIDDLIRIGRLVEDASVSPSRYALSQEE